MKTLIFIHVMAFAAMATAGERELENLLHEGNNKLTTRMFSQISNANEGKSFVMSAYSVMTPLAQLALASLNEARDELLDTIGMPDTNTTKEVFSLVDNKLRSIKGITLKTASKIYVAIQYELNEKFAADTRDVFGSEVQNVNFEDREEAAKTVNTWVEEQTNNRIKELVDPAILTKYTRALLVNAIYFKGSWKHKFDQSSTKDSDFYVNSAKTNTVSMMFRHGFYKYTESQELKSQIIEIPYEGDESSFVIVLPRDIEGINEVKEILKDSAVLENALQQMWKDEVDLFLPKFKIETTTDLKDILMKMNVTRMFDERTAQLDNLIKATHNLFVDSATQKAFIEVNEEGAEAAAANVFGVSHATSVGFPPITIRFVADHPFLFLIRGRDNTLFSGVYYS